MTTFQQIQANVQWFKHEITELDTRAGECLAATNAISCLHISEWPDQLSSFREAYDHLLGQLSTDTDIGYPTGRSRLTALSSTMETTAKAYIRAEAESEEDIRSEVLGLLQDL